MRLIINCDPENIGPATLLIHRELKRFGEYDRIGYGCTHYDGFQGQRYFVKRIRDGLSISQIGLRMTSQPQSGDAQVIEGEGSRESHNPSPSDPTQKAG